MARWTDVVWLVVLLGAVPSCLPFCGQNLQLLRRRATAWWRRMSSSRPVFLRCACCVTCCGVNVAFRARLSAEKNGISGAAAHSNAFYRLTAQRPLQYAILSRSAPFTCWHARRCAARLWRRLGVRGAFGGGPAVHLLQSSLRSFLRREGGGSTVAKGRTYAASARRRRHFHHAAATLDGLGRQTSHCLRPTSTNSAPCSLHLLLAGPAAVCGGLSTSALQPSVGGAPGRDSVATW